MKQLEWHKLLQEDTRLNDLGFSFYKTEECDFKSNVVKIGSSKGFSSNGYHFIVFSYLSYNDEKLRVSINNIESDIVFFINPDYESLLKVYKEYLEPAILEIPKSLGLLEDTNRVKTAEPISFTNKDKKNLMYFIGNACWDQMAELENAVILNDYTSTHIISLATAEGRDGTMSQYYTAFSASLCSIVRGRIYGTTMFYLQFEYFPMESNYIEQVKDLNIKNTLIKNFPNDAPWDILGMLLYFGGYIKTEEELFEDAKNGNYDSLLYLSAFTEYSNNFDKYFEELASSEDIKYRDFIAEEANLRESKKILEITLKKGISEELRTNLGL